MFKQGELAQNLDNSHKIPEWEFCGQVVKCSNDKKVLPLTKKILNCVKVHNTLKIGDQIEILMPGYQVLKKNLKKMWNEKDRKEIDEAHGGGGNNKILIESDTKIPELSVVRRKTK